MKLNYNKLFLAVIIFVALVLRFYRLGEAPPSLNWDESSNAYNAYSILKTQKDEYGNFLPLTNRSFDDYKPPLYMYLNVPTVAIFGLTPFAARLPSAIFGVLCVPLIYLLAKKLFDRKTALIAAAFMALSPWSIQFSRVGFEANVGFFFTLAFITCLLYGLTRPKLFLLASLMATLSFYSYHSQRIIIPLILLGFVIIFRQQLFKTKKLFLTMALLLVIVLSLPIVLFTPKEAIIKRFETTSAQTTNKNNEKSVLLIEEDKDANFPFAKYIHNRRIIAAQSLIGNLFNHFDPNFLFLEGDDNLRHHIKGMGQLYLFELPLLIMALFLLVRNFSKKSAFLLFLLLVAPIAAAPVHPAPHALRSFPMLIPLILLSSLGSVTIVSTKYRFKTPILIVLLIWVVSSQIIYIHNYFVHYARNEAVFWQYGYSQAVTASDELKDDWEKIYISPSIEQAYIFWLFNLKYDPGLYQTQNQNHNFDKFYFEAAPPTNAKDLYITTAKTFPEDFELISTIYYPNGEEAIKLGYPKPQLLK